MVVSVIEEDTPELSNGRSIRNNLRSIQNPTSRCREIDPLEIAFQHFPNIPKSAISTPAASNRYMRSMASPHFEDSAGQSISPEAWRHAD